MKVMRWNLILLLSLYLTEKNCAWSVICLTTFPALCCFILQNMSIGSISFGTGSTVTPLAVYTETSGALTGEFAIENRGGIIGNAMNANATYDTPLNQGSGSIQNIPRTDGLQ